MNKIFIKFLLVCLAVSFSSAMAQTIAVTNTNDSGAGSLRAAIASANANVDASTIVFNIPGAGPHIIQPDSLYAPLLYTTTIDGTSYSLGNVVVDFNKINSMYAYGFSLLGDNSMIKGLHIRNVSIGSNFTTRKAKILDVDFSGCDINIFGHNGNANWWGTGIEVIGKNVQINNNLITACADGIVVAGKKASITDNKIGTDALGIRSTGCQYSGILISCKGDSSIVSENLLVGNSEVSEFMPYDKGQITLISADDVKIQGNVIGRDVNGSYSGAPGNGIAINFNTERIWVGGELESEGNKVYNVQDGIRFKNFTGSISIYYNLLDQVSSMGINDNSYAPGKSKFFIARKNVINSLSEGIIIVNCDKFIATGNTIKYKWRGIKVENNTYTRIGSEEPNDGNKFEKAEIISAGDALTNQSGDTIIFQNNEVNVIDSYLFLSEVKYTLIQDNLFKGAVTGFSTNIYMSGMLGKCIIDNNTITKAEEHGVFIVDSDSVTVIRNKIGQFQAGQIGHGCLKDALQILECQNAVIKDNIIGGNGSGFTQYSGININNSSNLLIEGNYIGTNPDFENLSNNAVGIRLKGTSVNNTIKGNFIANNTGSGIYFENSTSNNKVYGNFIGTDPSRTINMGNAGSGVFIANSTDNIIGDSLTSNGNIIANNGIYGINVDTGENNKFFRNAIFNNTNKGIALTNNGNNLKAVPAISTYNIISTTSVQLQGSSGANDSIEVFVSDINGKNTLRSAGFAKANSSGTWSLTISNPQAYNPNSFNYYVATATNNLNNTSELSAMFSVGTMCTVTNTNDNGPGSLRAAIACANASPDASKITFDIPGSGPFIIQPDSLYAPLLYTTAIDASNYPLGTIVVDFNKVNSKYAYGFSLMGDNSSIEWVTVKNVKYGSNTTSRKAKINDLNFTGCAITEFGHNGNMYNKSEWGTGIEIIGSNVSVINTVIDGCQDGIVVAGRKAIIKGNKIGTDLLGAKGSGINASGILLTCKGDSALIGGSNNGDKNIIVRGTNLGTYGSTSEVQISNISVVDADNVVIKGNLLGKDVNGNSFSTLNLGIGIGVQFGSDNIIIGGENENEGNEIAKVGRGVYIYKYAGNAIINNNKIENCDNAIRDYYDQNDASLVYQYNKINILKNKISGSGFNAISFSFTDTLVCLGNEIIGMWSYAFNLDYNVKSAYIGSYKPEDRNIISIGNASGSIYAKDLESLFIENNIIEKGGSLGIYITGTKKFSLVKGNKLGTNELGAVFSSPSWYMVISLQNNQGKNIIENNIIASSLAVGIGVNLTDSVEIIDNKFGKYMSGLEGFNINSGGIELQSGTSNSIVRNNIFGGIGSNSYSNAIYSDANSYLTIEGNYIGFNEFNENIGNIGNGIYIAGGGANSIVGNKIGFNGGIGIQLNSSNNNKIFNNNIGTDSTGTINAGNAGFGIFLNNSGNNVIGNTSGKQNNIANNGVHGIYVAGSSSQQNRIVGNPIFNNISLEGIKLYNGGNNSKVRPYDITSNISYSTITISGKSEPGDIIDIYESDAGGKNANKYIDSTIADGDGNWTYNYPLYFIYYVNIRGYLFPIEIPINDFWGVKYFVATATNNKNTSEFSELITACRNNVIASASDSSICKGSVVQLSSVAASSEGFSYQWSPSTGLSNPNIAHPVATVDATTSYIVTLSSGGCIVRDTVTIDVLQPPVINSVTTSDVKCYDYFEATVNKTINLGVGTINASGGVAPYEYSIDGINYFSSNIFDTLRIGTYTARVRDANGCVGTRNFSIQYKGILVSIGCIGRTRCSIPTTNVKFTVTKQLPPESCTSFWWNVVNTKTNQTVAIGLNNFGNEVTAPLANAVESSYSLNIYQECENCPVISTPFNISQAQFTASLSNDINPGSTNVFYTCGTSGGLKMKVKIGNNLNACSATPTYIDSIYKYNESTQLFEYFDRKSVSTDTTSFVLNPGKYRLRSSISPYGCLAGPLDFDIIPTSLDVNVVKWEPKCAGDNGFASAVIASGLDPISYAWFETGDTDTLSKYASVKDLEPGNYTLTVRDGRGCLRNESFNIPAAPELNIPDITVSGCKAVADIVDLSPARKPYTFTWVYISREKYKVPDPESPDTVAHFIEKTDNQEKIVFVETVSDLQSGKYVSAPAIADSAFLFRQGLYFVRVKDTYGCIVESALDSIKQAQTFNFELGFRWSNVPKISPPPPPPVPPTVQGLTMASATMQKQLEEQAQSCVNTKVAEVKEMYKESCSKADSISDYLAVQYEMNTSHFTLYYYDRAGNLTKTVPPEGVNRLTTKPSSRNEEANYELATTYDYNSLKQLTKQTTPDGGTTKFLYNDKLQLRFSQNSKQGAEGAYSYTKYDPLFRVIEVGESKSGTFASLNSNTYLNNNVDAPELAWPTEQNSQQTYTFYNRKATWATYMGKGRQRFVQNRVSYTSTINKSGDTVWTYYSYDPHGNVEWLMNDIQGFSKAWVGYDYDLISNKVLKVKYNEYLKDKFFHRYSYDEDNRLLTAETSRDGYVWDKDAAYNYYVHGPLRRTELGQDKVQGLDYTYTIHGWLKGINSPNLVSAEDPGKDGTNLFAKDEYGMMLGYYDGDFNRTGSVFNATSGNMYNLNNNGGNLYNGNISTWTNKMVDSVLNGNVYRYDRLNRLTAVDFKKFNGTGYTATTAYKERFRYDANGNILGLYRKADKDMDSLVYTYYEKSNKLKRVKDTVATARYHYDIDNQVGDNYTYDGIGNLTRDVQENIDIKWNVYGKVAEVKSYEYRPGKHHKHIRFSYDAAGNRVMKEVNDSLYGPGGVEQRLPKYITTTYYVRDASGNIMSVYEKKYTPLSGDTTYTVAYTQKEIPVYGSDRLGNVAKDTLIASLITGKDKVFKVSYTPSDDLNHIAEADTAIASYNYVRETKTDSITAAVQSAIFTIAPNNTDLLLPAGQSLDTAFIGKLGNNVAIAFDEKGVTQFAAVAPENYWGNKNALLIYDKDNNFMDGSGGIIADSKAKAVAFKKQGTDFEYHILTRDTAGSLNLVTIDMSQEGNGSVTGGKKGKVISVASIPAPEGSQSWGRHFAVAEDRIHSKTYVFATNYKTDTLALIKFTFENAAFSFEQQGQLVSKDSLGDGVLQISTDGKQLALTNYQKGQGWFATKTTEVNFFPLDEYFNMYGDKLYANNAKPFLVYPLPYGASKETSLAYDKNSQGIFIGQNALVKHPVSGSSKTAWYYEIASGNLTKAATERSGEVSRVKEAGTVAYVQPQAEGALSSEWVPDGAGGFTVTTHDITSSVTCIIYNGSWTHQNHIIDNAQALGERLLARYVGSRLYEIKDHLGNVRVVVSDNKGSQIDGAGTIVGLMANVRSFSNYYAFGMTQPGRSMMANEYRYGFNGKEKDGEWNSGGAIYDYGFRIYDPRIAKFLSVDPLTKSYPMLTPYQFASNTPIQAIDLDGLEAYKKTTTDPNTGKTLIEITIDVKVKNSTKNNPISDEAAISYAGDIVRQLGATYSGDVDANTKVVVKANIINLEVDDNGKMILEKFETKGAFYIEFVDEVTGVDDPDHTGGRADVMGNPTINRFRIRVPSVSDPKTPRSSSDISRTGTHEIGHGLGLRHPWDPGNDVTDVDQQDVAHGYVPSQGVKESTIIDNIMNSFANPNIDLRPKTDGGSTQSTSGQRRKIGDVVPEKK